MYVNAAGGYLLQTIPTRSGKKSKYACNSLHKITLLCRKCKAKNIILFENRMEFRAKMHVKCELLNIRENYALNMTRALNM